MRSLLLLLLFSFSTILGYSQDLVKNYYQLIVSDLNSSGSVKTSSVKSNPAVPVSETDSLALVNLYNATQGYNWANNSGWLTDPVYTWYGVTIDSNGRVIALDLSNNNLNGYISADLGNLTELRTLLLDRNDLSGQIPITFSNLTKLKHLDLSANDLSGDFPLTLCQLDSLSYLDLSNNEFEGPIPDDIGNLQNLDTLKLVDNNFSGSFPLGLTTLANLKYLDLSFNNLEGPLPEEIGNLQNLQVLSMVLVGLSGPIPQSIYTLSNLVALMLYDDYTGSISPDIENLSNLAAFLIGGESISGTLPPELFYLQNLSELVIYNTQISGTIPQDVDSAKNLSVLVLSHCQLTSPIPLELGNLTNLNTLNLDHNNFTGTVPVVLGSLINLQYMDLSNNQFTGEIPATFQGLTQLIELSLDSNQFTSIAPQLFSLSNLRKLYLNNNQITGPLSDSIQYMTSLQKLDISHNQFTGAIPPGIASTRLSYFNFSYNKFTSLPDNLDLLPVYTLELYGKYNLIEKLPSNLGDVSTLYVLDLSYNVLRDTINSFFSGAAMSKLSRLDLSGNGGLYANLDSSWAQTYHYLVYLDLHNTNIDASPLPYDFFLNPYEYLNLNNLRIDSIDSRWAYINELKELYLSGCNISYISDGVFEHLDSLRVLDLSGNELFTSIPDSIFALPKVEYMSLKGSYIEQQIPECINQMVNIKHLDLSFNRFTGQLPSISNLTNLQYLDISNNNLEGNLPDLTTLTQLDTLIISENNFTGPLPEFSQLPNLSYFESINNSFSGTLPELSPDTKFKHFYLRQTEPDSLTGTIPSSYGFANFNLFFLVNTNVSGMLPSGFSDDSLRYLGIIQTNIDSIPPLNNASLDIVYITQNKIDFGDLENVKAALNDGANFVYSPQKNLGDTLYYKYIPGDDYLFNIRVDGTGNHYQWVKNDTDTLVNDTLTYLQITSATDQDTGKYTCVITNPEFPLLTLNTNPIYLTATALRATFVVTGPDNNPIQGALITIGDFNTLTDANGQAYFDNIPGTFTAVITKDGYEDATVTFTLNSDTTINVTLTPVIAGVSDLNKINIYPNPTSGLLRFDVPGDSKVQLDLYTLDGQLIRRFDLNGRNIIDLSGLQSGVYIMKIKTDEGTITRRIIKQ